jgi:hypothetical protein
MPQMYHRAGHSWNHESRLLAVLTARPSVALCMACLVVATGLRIADASGEIERDGARVDAWEARCDRCDQAAAIFVTTNG